MVNYKLYALYIIDAYSYWQVTYWCVRGAPARIVRSVVLAVCNLLQFHVSCSLVVVGGALSVGGSAIALRLPRVFFTVLSRWAAEGRQSGCVQTYIHTYIHVFIHTRTNTYACIRTYIRTYIYIHRFFIFHMQTVFARLSAADRRSGRRCARARRSPTRAVRPAPFGWGRGGSG